MKSNSQVVKDWMNGKDSKGRKMFAEGDVIYSFGYHFPICKKLPNGKYLFNSERYSNSTQKHQSLVERKLGFHAEIFFCNTRELNLAICNPKDPIVIKRKEYHQTYEDALLNLITVLKEKYGIERFPRKKLEDWLRNTLLPKVI